MRSVPHRPSVVPLLDWLLGWGRRRRLSVLVAHGNRLILVNHNRYTSSCYTT